MPAIAYEETYSKDDYYKWEGDWELIYGTPYAMSPSPMFGHQYISMKISRQLDENLDNCSSCYALFETDIEFSDDTIVRPDCMVICYEPRERLNRAPEIVFEIISKSSARRDEKLKFEIYQDEGVKYYVLVYPNKAKVYKLEKNRYIKVGDFKDERYNFKIKKCNIDFNFNLIWKK